MRSIHVQWNLPIALSKTDAVKLSNSYTLSSATHDLEQKPITTGKKIELH